jgi:hypothetical protein
MYILTFKSSRSKYFQKGLDMARELGGTWDGETMVLKVPEDGLLDAYDMLLPLFQIVSNWSSLRASYRGKEVDPYRFILVMYFIRECAEIRKENQEHCWLISGEKGWGCKRISHIMYQLLGDGQYRRNDKYWYNFGGFNEHNEWVVDKEELYRRLSSFAEEKGLTICPYFRDREVRKAVDALPSSIVPDNKSFRVYYEEDHFHGRKVKVPVNIRHIPDPPDKYKKQETHYNADAIIPIDKDTFRKLHTEPLKGSFWNLFSKN